MSVMKIFGALLSIFALGTLVAGESALIIVMNSIKVTNNANDYFDEVKMNIAQEDKASSKITAKLPVKKDLPDTMMIKLVIIMDGQDPMEFDTSLCDAMEDETIGKTFVDAGIPAADFPKNCPVTAGDWSIVDWQPPTDSIPPSIPDGPITGSMIFYEEGQDPYVLMEYEGELLHPPPSY